LSFAESAQTRALIGFADKFAFYGVAQNYQNMKIIAEPD
jgi:hypothetical protein